MKLNLPMVKPFLLTYLAMGCHLLSLNLNHCLSDLCLLLTYRPILRLPEYKLKVVNICEMQGTGVLKLWCLTDFSDT